MKINLERNVNEERLISVLKEKVKRDVAGKYSYETMVDKTMLEDAFGVIEQLLKEKEELLQRCDAYKEKYESYEKVIADMNENARKQIIELKQENEELKQQNTKNKKPDCYSVFSGSLEVCKRCEYNDSCIHAVKEQAAKELYKTIKPNCFGKYNSEEDPWDGDCTHCYNKESCIKETEGKTNA